MVQKFLPPNSSEHYTSEQNSSLTKMTRITATKYSTEWDLTFTYHDDTWEYTHQALLDHLNEQPMEGVKFLMVSNVERGIRYEEGQPVRNEEASYHSHGICIMEDEVPKDHVLKLCGVLKPRNGSSKVPVIRRWAKKRNQGYSYIGWMMHHLKPRSKVYPDTHMTPSFIHGSLTPDEESYHSAVIICAMAKKYQFPDVYQHWVVIRERLRPPRTRKQITEEQMEERRTKKKAYEARYNTLSHVRQRKQERDRQRNMSQYHSRKMEVLRLQNIPNRTSDEEALLARNLSLTNATDSNPTFQDRYQLWKEEQGYSD